MDFAALAAQWNALQVARQVAQDAVAAARSDRAAAKAERQLAAAMSAIEGFKLSLSADEWERFEQVVLAG